MMTYQTDDQRAPEPSGGQSAETAEIRSHHYPRQSLNFAGFLICAECLHLWPCDTGRVLAHLDALTQTQRDQAERLAAAERQNVRLRAVLRRVLVNRPNWEHRDGILVVTEGWWMHWEAEARAAILAETEGA